MMSPLSLVLETDYLKVIVVAQEHIMKMMQIVNVNLVVTNVPNVKELPITVLFVQDY